MKDKEQVIEYLESFIEFCDCKNPKADCICPDKNGWHESKEYKLQTQNKLLLEFARDFTSLVNYYQNNPLDSRNRLNEIYQSQTYKQVAKLLEGAE